VENPEPDSPDVHLGDGVYAYFDSNGVSLRKCKTIIYIEPEVVFALENFILDEFHNLNDA
jgi:hypothetical protein